MCSETSSPCSTSFSFDVISIILLFILSRIFLKRYCAIARGHSGNWSFVIWPFSSFGNAIDGMIMWKPLPPENFSPIFCMPWSSNCSIKSSAAILP